MPEKGDKEREEWEESARRDRGKIERTKEEGRNRLKQGGLICNLEESRGCSQDEFASSVQGWGCNKVKKKGNRRVYIFFLSPSVAM